MRTSCVLNTAVVKAARRGSLDYTDPSTRGRSQSGPQSYRNQQHTNYTHFVHTIPTLNTHYTHIINTLYKYYTHANSVHVQMHAEFIYMCVYHFMGFMFVFRSLFTSLSNSPAALKKTQQHQCGFNMQKTNLLIISKSSDIGSCIAIVHKKWLVHWVEQYLHL